MSSNPQRLSTAAALHTSVEQSDLLRERSAAELFLMACSGGYEDDDAWAAVHALRRRGSDEVFILALHHLTSELALHRSRALNVLAQFKGEKPVSEFVTPALAALADPEPQVVTSAAWVLADRTDDPRSIPTLLVLRRHPLPGVREAVVNGLYRR